MLDPKKLCKRKAPKFQPVSLRQNGLACLESPFSRLLRNIEAFPPLEQVGASSSKRGLCTSLSGFLNPWLFLPLALRLASGTRPLQHQNCLENKVAEALEPLDYGCLFLLLGLVEKSPPPKIFQIYLSKCSNAHHGRGKPGNNLLQGN